MTDEERSRELTRSSFAAQMAMLGYEPNGNPKDMVEVVRCKDCKHGRKHNVNIIECMKAHDYNLEHQEFHHKNWFCADGRKKDAD